MGFRRNSDKEHQWQTWLAKHRSELEACGLPPEILNNARQWALFLQEGEVLEGKWQGWRCTMLSTAQAVRLLRLLETEKLLSGWYVDLWLLTELRRIAGPTSGEDTLDAREG